MNWKKTKVTKVVRQKGHCEVRICDMEIEQVDEVSGGDDQQRWDYGEGS